MFIASFSNDWYELKCYLGMFVGVGVHKQCRSLQFSLKQTRLAWARLSETRTLFMLERLAQAEDSGLGRQAISLRRGTLA